jgi:hypothetical protein
MRTFLRLLLGILIGGIIGVRPAAAGDSAGAWPIASAAPIAAQSAGLPIMAGDPPRRLAQATPIAPPKHIPLWPEGFDYTVDFSVAWPFGNTGAPKTYGLPGGMDGIFRYTWGESSRLSVGWYDLQEYPIGFDTGVVPLYLQGVATPIGPLPCSASVPAGCVNLATPPVGNVGIKNKIVIAHFDQVFWTKLLGQDFPLIVSPTYTQRWGTIGGGDDLLPVEIDGFPYEVHYRTGSFGAIGLTFPVPLLTQPRRGLVTTYTIGPQWLMNLQGANVNNHAQLVQILHTVWHPTRQIQIDLQPSLYPNFLPTDKWPQHYFTMIYSAAYSFGYDQRDPWGRPLTRHLIPFIQATVSMGGAINIAPYGITALYCQQLPCTSASQLVPALGGNHAAQFQLKFGIGRPSVIPL